MLKGDIFSEKSDLNGKTWHIQWSKPSLVPGCAVVLMTAHDDLV